MRKYNFKPMAFTNNSPENWMLKSWTTRKYKTGSWSDGVIRSFSWGKHFLYSQTSWNNNDVMQGTIIIPPIEVPRQERNRKPTRRIKR